MIIHVRLESLHLNFQLSNNHISCIKHSLIIYRCDHHQNIFLIMKKQGRKELSEYCELNIYTHIVITRMCA